MGRTARAVEEVTLFLTILRGILALVGLYREERLRADGARAQREADKEASDELRQIMHNVEPDDPSKRLRDGSF